MQFDRAISLLCQEKEFKAGFKFHHVWEKMKDVEKFAPHHGDSSSQVNSQDSSSPNLSSFSINLSDDGSPTPTSSQRPIGIKKAKLKRKQNDDSTAAIEVLTRQNEELMAMMRRKAERRELQDERKIMMMDINTISDPVARTYIESERAKYMQKRADQALSNNISDGFGGYFNDLGPSNNNLGDY